MFFHRLERTQFRDSGEEGLAGTARRNTGIGGGRRRAERRERKAVERGRKRETEKEERRGSGGEERGLEHGCCVGGVTLKKAHDARV